MSDLHTLHHLQELDLSIEAQNRVLQEIEATLGETRELLDARARVQRLQDLLHAQQHQLRELEYEAEELGRHLAHDEQRLYGGSIRNPKELEGLRRDLEQRQAQRRELEDRQLQLMADVEVSQAELAEAQTELTRVQAASGEKNRELLDRQAEVKERITKLTAERARLAGQVTPANLSLYERLRKEKRGRAVSTIERATCQGCRIALPMGLVQRARAGRELAFCPSCGRILYA